MTRLLIWMLLGIVLMVLTALMLDESRQLEVTRHRLGREGEESTPGVSIAQVSDLHITGNAEVEESVLRVLAREKPELILFTGDMVASRKKMAALGQFLDRLDGQARKVAIPGNWEYWAGIDTTELRRFYAEHGVTLLVNEAVTFTRKGETLLLVGLDDSRHGQPDWKKALDGHRDWSGPLLVLAHNPLTLPMIPAAERSRKNRVMLAGHTHGGQIVLFGNGWRRSQPCLSGWCRDGGMPMYVSRGLGTSVIPLRIGAPPELALFTWHW
ncbi:MAG: metallophosphoesterase family protein [Magnetococcales bacterium]|nr:metallophosphoesterase family protein [Magnetococcales bacterium]